MFSDLEMPVIGADDGCGGSGGRNNSSGYGSVQNSKQEPHKQASKQLSTISFVSLPINFIRLYSPTQVPSLFSAALVNSGAGKGTKAT